MQVLSRTSDNLKRCYNVLIERKEVEDAVDDKLREIAKKVKMDGFRPGKVPIDIVRRLHGESAKTEAKKDLVPEMAKKVLRDEKVTLTFAATTDVVKEDDNGIEFTLRFELTPVVELKDFSTIELVKRVPEITDNEINEVLHDLLRDHKKWIDEPGETEIELGHKVFVNLVSKTKLKSSKTGNISDDIDFVVGDESIMEEFWKPMLGAKFSDVVEFSVAYPEHAHDKTYAGKTVDYSATINKVQKATEYLLDDEFADCLGHENIAETMVWAKARSLVKYERISKDLMKRDLLERISEMFDFEVPVGMLDLEYAEVVRQITAEATKIGKAMTPDVMVECRKIAEQRVRIGFVVAEVAKQENITVTRREVAEAIRNIAALFPGREEEIWDVYSKEEAVNTVVGPILESKVTDLLFEKAKITEELCPIDKLIELDEEPFDFFKDDVVPKKLENDPTPDAANDVGADVADNQHVAAAVVTDTETAAKAGNDVGADVPDTESDTDSEAETEVEPSE
ncbi:trigger factor [Alphaproteobacteria bacterium]|nr:trigger factor [Alphaproteobacteria bacterium]